MTPEEEKEAIYHLKTMTVCSQRQRKAINSMIAEYEKLIHFRDTTVGLWATDMPKEFKDPKKLLFQIRYK